MKNATSMKALMKNIAKEKNISAQLVMQNYMLERLLERISLSDYKFNFILKGGFLIAAMVGLDTRATMDMDATIKGYPVTEESIREMFKVICDVSIDDDITFTLNRVYEIREKDEYTGYRVSLDANYPPMKIPLKLDITTGDKITPKEIQYEFKLLLEERSIKVLAYNLETVLAEKLETIIARGTQNTRPRDFYDVYILRKLQWKNIDISCLRDALNATCQKRNSAEIIKDYSKIIDTIRNDGTMQKRWLDYQKDFEYANSIGFNEACASVNEMLLEAFD